MNEGEPWHIWSRIQPDIEQDMEEYECPYEVPMDMDVEDDSETQTLVNSLGSSCTLTPGAFYSSNVSCDGTAACHEGEPDVFIECYSKQEILGNYTSNEDTIPITGEYNILDWSEEELADIFEGGDDETLEFIFKDVNVDDRVNEMTTTAEDGDVKTHG